ncbi:MAG: acyltransferase, partial [Dehalococcoidia bacterium]|nr:acyltransferase [Dehalococcoidia bacterium]
MSSLPHATATSPDARTKSRLLHLDWLRVLAMGAIFLFHNLRAYDFTDWHIKNSVTTQAASSLVEILNHWMMPLFFVLSSA